MRTLEYQDDDQSLFLEVVWMQLVHGRRVRGLCCNKTVNLEKKLTEVRKMLLSRVYFETVTGQCAASHIKAWKPISNWLGAE